MHPSDLLTEALCGEAKVHDGHGVLFYGLRIEFYHYNPGTPWIDSGSDDKESNSAGSLTASDPSMFLIHAGEVIDVRTSELAMVDHMFR